MQNSFKSQFAAHEALEKVKYVMDKTNWGFTRDVSLGSSGEGTFYVQYLSSDGTYKKLPDEDLKAALYF
jgi:hypothetical protein